MFGSVAAFIKRAGWESAPVSPDEPVQVSAEAGAGPAPAPSPQAGLSITGILNRARFDDQAVVDRRQTGPEVEIPPEQLREDEVTSALAAAFGAASLVPTVDDPMTGPLPSTPPSNPTPTSAPLILPPSDVIPTNSPSMVESSDLPSHPLMEMAEPSSAIPATVEGAHNAPEAVLAMVERTQDENEGMRGDGGDMAQQSSEAPLAITQGRPLSPVIAPPATARAIGDGEGLQDEEQGGARAEDDAPADQSQTQPEQFCVILRPVGVAKLEKPTDLGSESPAESSSVGESEDAVSGENDGEGENEEEEMDEEEMEVDDSPSSPDLRPSLLLSDPAILRAYVDSHPIEFDLLHRVSANLESMWEMRRSLSPPAAEASLDDQPSLAGPSVPRPRWQTTPPDNTSYELLRAHQEDFNRQGLARQPAGLEIDEFMPFNDYQQQMDIVRDDGFDLEGEDELTPLSSSPQPQKIPCKRKSKGDGAGAGNEAEGAVERGEHGSAKRSRKGKEREGVPVTPSKDKGKKKATPAVTPKKSAGPLPRKGGESGRKKGTRGHSPVTPSAREREDDEVVHITRSGTPRTKHMRSEVAERHNREASSQFGNQPERYVLLPRQLACDRCQYNHLNCWMELPDGEGATGRRKCLPCGTDVCSFWDHQTSTSLAPTLSDIQQSEHHTARGRRRHRQGQGQQGVKPGRGERRSERRRVQPTEHTVAEPLNEGGSDPSPTRPGKTRSGRVMVEVPQRSRRRERTPEEEARDVEDNPFAGGLGDDGGMDMDLDLGGEGLQDQQLDGFDEYGPAGDGNWSNSDLPPSDFESIPSNHSPPTSPPHPPIPPQFLPSSSSQPALFPMFEGDAQAGPSNPLGSSFTRVSYRPPPPVPAPPQLDLRGAHTYLLYQTGSLGRQLESLQVAGPSAAVLQSSVSEIERVLRELLNGQYLPPPPPPPPGP